MECERGGDRWTVDDLGEIGGTPRPRSVSSLGARRVYLADGAPVRHQRFLDVF